MASVLAFGYLLSKGMVRGVILYDSGVDGPAALFLKCEKKGYIIFVIQTTEFGELCGTMSQLSTDGRGEDTKAVLVDGKGVYEPARGMINVVHNPNGPWWGGEGWGVCLYMGNVAYGFQMAYTRPTLDGRWRAP